MTQMISRITYVLAPLLIVAIVSAGEWPARAQMLEGPLRAPVYEVATRWNALVNGAPVLPSAPSDAAPVMIAAAAPSAPIRPTEVKPPPRPAAPLAPATSGKVLLLGDSLMGGVAAGLRQELPREFVFSDRHRSSTGLTNDGYYNWVAMAGEFTSQEKPQWVFIHLGGNDGQDMMVEGKWVGFGTEAWQAQYLERAKLMIRNVQAAAPSAAIVWIGLPAMRPEKYERKTRLIAGLQERAAREMGVAFSSGLDALGQSYVRQGTGVDGKQHVMRLDDGIHYSREGGRTLAHAARKFAVGLP